MSFIIIARWVRLCLRMRANRVILNIVFFLKENFFMFLYYFDMLISKIIFNKIKKNYFDGFLSKNNIF
jgi:hypothetical protein